MKKRLIEYDLPLADISEESAREKNIRHGHPSTLHIWWARRPLASSRATAFAALIDDPGEENPEEREYLLDLVKRITPWEAVKKGNSADIEEARQLIAAQYGRPPRVLDPFAGGGSIPLEALRLGCETYANDYNPVAVFIEKATLEWPQKFGIEVELPVDEMKQPASSTQLELTEIQNRKSKTVNLLAYLVEKWANIILEEAHAEIGRFYPEDDDGWIPVGYLWARTIPCQNPSCGAEIPLVKQFWLAKKSNKKIAYRPVVDKKNKSVAFELLEDKEAIKAVDFEPGEGTVTRSDVRCPVCEQIMRAKDLRKLAKANQMGERLVGVIMHSPHQSGKRYRLATENDLDVFLEAIEYLKDKLANWPHLESPIPEEEIPLMSGTFNVPIYGLDQWNKLFNDRQKLALITFSEKIKDCYDRLAAECEKLATELRLSSSTELAHALIGYLGIVFSRQVDRTSNISRLDVTRESLQGTYSRQALPMIWDYAGWFHRLCHIGDICGLNFEKRATSGRN